MKRDALTQSMTVMGVQTSTCVDYSNSEQLSPQMCLVVITCYRKKIPYTLLSFWKLEDEWSGAKVEFSI